jgi:hypothetical protein
MGAGSCIVDGVILNDVRESTVRWESTNLAAKAFLALLKENSLLGD